MSSPRPIPKRDLRFDFADVDLANWHPDGRFVSHYFNVHSLQFPDGERFFINSVRHYRERITDPVLREQVAGFIAQEAMHGREHEGYNAALERIGYPVAAMLRAVNRSLWLPRHVMPPRGRLAMTAALEHLTAIGAEDLLEQGHRLDAADPRMAQLWRWHAIEETEHKAVAFDVYQQVTGGGFVAWLRRCSTMLTASIGMTLMTWSFLVGVIRRDGRLFDWRGWAGLLRWLWLEPGTLRRQFPRYWQWFRPGFHPWQVDNYHQVERWAALDPTQRQGGRP